MSKMMKRTISLVMAVSLSFFLLISCNMDSGDQGDFKTTESGLKYKLVEVNEDDSIPQEGDILSLVMTYGSEDSVLFNTNQIPDKKMILQHRPSAYPGDFYEMMTLMHKGDSAVFMLDANDFFMKTAGARGVPPGFDSTQLVFKVKLQDVQSQQAFEDMQKAEMELKRESEIPALEKYLSDNNITQEPTESGLYVIVTEKGKGPKPKKGDKIKAHYTGTLLDGTKFDSSVDRGTPFEFPLGQGRVIRGWDEGFAMLNVGSKATLIMPSSLGYGERGSGSGIPPFSPLIFKVELIEIVK